MGEWSDALEASREVMDRGDARDVRDWMAANEIDRDEFLAVEQEVARLGLTQLPRHELARVLGGVAGLAMQIGFMVGRDRGMGR